MDYYFAPMDDTHARAVADWHYDGAYAFYDFAWDPEDLAELMDPRRREGRHFVVLDGSRELVGFFCFDAAGDSIELGLGLAPHRTGSGLGAGFLAAGMAFARERYHPRRFCLKVAAFNRRAIRVYERSGFRIEKTFRRATNGGLYDFISMVCQEDG